MARSLCRQATCCLSIWQFAVAAVVIFFQEGVAGAINRERDEFADGFPFVSFHADRDAMRDLHRRKLLHTSDEFFGFAYGLFRRIATADAIGEESRFSRDSDASLFSIEFIARPHALTGETTYSQVTRIGIPGTEYERYAHAMLKSRDASGALPQLRDTGIAELKTDSAGFYLSPQFDAWLCSDCCIFQRHICGPVASEEMRVVSLIQARQRLETVRCNGSVELSVFPSRMPKNDREMVVAAIRMGLAQIAQSRDVEHQSQSQLRRRVADWLSEVANVLFDEIQELHCRFRISSSDQPALVELQVVPLPGSSLALFISDVEQLSVPGVEVLEGDKTFQINFASRGTVVGTEFGALLRDSFQTVGRIRRSSDSHRQRRSSDAAGIQVERFAVWSASDHSHAPILGLWADLSSSASMLFRNAELAGAPDGICRDPFSVTEEFQLMSTAPHHWQMPWGSTSFGASGDHVAMQWRANPQSLSFQADGSLESRLTTERSLRACCSGRFRCQTVLPACFDAIRPEVLLSRRIRSELPKLIASDLEGTISTHFEGASVTVRADFGTSDAVVYNIFVSTCGRLLLLADLWD